MKKLIIIMYIFLVLTTSSVLSAELNTGLNELNADGVIYSLYVPTVNSHTMIVALHGSGESSRGYIDNWLEDAAKQGYVILAPQATDRNGWQGVDINQILQETAYYKKYFDIKKTIISGASSGGHIALLLGINYYDLYDGCATFMGNISPNMLKWIKFQASPSGRRKIIMIHGEKDKMIPIEYGRKTAELLKQKGYKVTFLAYPDMHHEHYRKANPAIIKWIDTVK